ncbi:lysozyme [Nitrincola sp. A-D6]|uniref:N-acetylmuramoyl-L-alanine amidase n=1 Tax=Nitrincola sp. A-D6 TaxID=1545442 RepID=UPI00051FB77D|nr:N-acetylmuramoyl-L-alanine amidase [Nitrincola sp. A-D6]KGK41209.1 lysozyme [Nitrincola sp. A-D6]
MATKQRNRTDFIVVHCSATNENQDIGAYDIDRWHRGRGWLKIGYHYVIKRDGTLEVGRNENAVGAHAHGYNSNSVSVCMVGGVSADDHNKAVNNFTDAQFKTLQATLTVLKARYETAEILGHRDLPNVAKACPCFDTREWVKENLK